MTNVKQIPQARGEDIKNQALEVVKMASKPTKAIRKRRVPLLIMVRNRLGSMKMLRMLDMADNTYDLQSVHQCWKASAKGVRRILRQAVLFLVARIRLVQVQHVCSRNGWQRKCRADVSVKPCDVDYRIHFMIQIE